MSSGTSPEGTSVAAATLAIDLPQHGARRGDSDESPDILVFNFLNPRTARDNFTQGAADLFALVHFATGATIEAADSPTDEAITFDPSRVSLFAHSQGSTHAGLMLGHESELYAVLLSGAGGDLTQSLLTKTEPVDIAGIVPFALLDPAPDGSLTAGDFHPALALWQAYFETVDPVNYGRRLRREPVDGIPGRHVFMSYGLGDTYSTEPTLQAYSLSIGLPLVGSVLVDYGLSMGDRTADVQRVDRGDELHHGAPPVHAAPGRGRALRHPAVGAGSVGCPRVPARRPRRRSASHRGVTSQ